MLSREKLRRLVLFPLALFYVAVLVVGVWPRQLQPGGFGWRAQRAANYVLAQLGWPAGLTVFSGQGDRPTATLRNCFRISGRAADGTRTVLFDSMSPCREHNRAFFKDPLVGYQNRMLAEALPMLRDASVPANRNTHPINALYSIADYYCHQGPFELLMITGRYQKVVLATGEHLDDLVVEGAHHCSDGRWEALGARPPGHDDGH